MEEEKRIRIKDSIECADNNIAKLHSIMCVLSGYMYNNMAINDVALNSLECMEILHSKLYELAQEISNIRQEFGGTSKVEIPHSLF